MAISASEEPLGRVFTSDYRLSIPSFQRAYSWRPGNVLQLLDDIRQHPAVDHAPFARYDRGASRLHGRASPGQVHGTQGLRRGRPLRHGCRHLPGRQGCRQRRDDRVPERHEGNGPCPHETLQHAAWHPARHGRSTGRGMDPRDQVSKTGIPVPARLPFGSRAFCFLLAAPARRFLASGNSCTMARIALIYPV